MVYVGSDSIVAGQLQMEWLADKLGGKGNVVIMNGQLDQEAAKMRTAGVKEVAAKFPDIQIIKEDTGNWSYTRPGAHGELALHHDQIDAVASNNDEMAIGAISAIKAAGKLGEILVGGVDASPDTLAAMDAGELNVTVFQNAAGQGEGGIRRPSPWPTGKLSIGWASDPSQLVTPENYKDYMK